MRVFLAGIGTDGVAAPQQPAHHRLAEEAAAAGDQRLHCSSCAAHSASFSRKIFALWRISTGNRGWKRSIDDAGGQRILRGEFQQLRADARMRGSRHAQFGLDAEDRPLPPRPADADQCAAENLPVGVEHRLAGDGEKGAGGGADAVRLAAAEPDAPLRVAIAEIPHAMKEAAGRIDYFAERRRFGTTEIGLRHLRSLNDDLADFPIGQLQFVSPLCYRLVADGDDFDPDAGHRPANADAFPLIGAPAGFAEDFPAADGTDRQRLGGAVGGEDFRLRRQQGGKTLQNLRRHRRAGGNHPPQARQANPVFQPVASDPVDQGRRAEHVGDLEMLDGGDEFLRIDQRRPGKVHLRDDRRHPQRRGEEGEEGEGRQIDFAGADVVEIAQHLHLRGEIAVAVDGPFRYAGAAAGKENGGGLLRIGRRQGVRDSRPEASRAACARSFRPSRSAGQR